MSECLYFLRYWAICVFQLFVSQVVTSYISISVLSFKPSNIILFIKPFFCMTKKSRQKFKYLQKKKSFLTLFKGISVAKNYIRHKNALLSQSFDCWNFFLFWNTAGRNEHFSNRRQYSIWQTCLFTKKLTNLFSSTILRYFVIVPYQFVRSLQIAKNNNLMGVGEEELEEF